MFWGGLGAARAVAGGADNFAVALTVIAGLAVRFASAATDGAVDGLSSETGWAVCHSWCSFVVVAGEGFLRRGLDYRTKRAKGN